MTRAKRPLLSIIISTLIWIGLGIVIWKISPSAWWIEVLTLILLFISIFLSTSWVAKSWKRGGLVATTILGILVMRRLQILDILTGGLWLLVLGLISLVI